MVGIQRIYVWSAKCREGATHSGSTMHRQRVSRLSKPPTTSRSLSSSTSPKRVAEEEGRDEEDAPTSEPSKARLRGIVPRGPGRYRVPAVLLCAPCIALDIFRRSQSHATPMHFFGPRGIGDDLRSGIGSTDHRHYGWRRYYSLPP